MICCQNLHIHQGAFQLKDINFQIEKGSYSIFMGRTGCGKTSIIEVICGLRKAVLGQIFINEKNISTQKPAERNIGFVPQDGALFNHMSVAANIGFALKIRKIPVKKIEQLVRQIATLFKISHLLKRKPSYLSGGEKQRVALARAVVFKPSLLCLDEPLSALDTYTKKEIIALLLEIKNRFKMTVLHITHDTYEAEKLSDNLFLIENGKLIKKPKNLK